MDVQPILNDVFGSSPLAHIERHSEACLNCVRMLRVYFEAAQAGEERGFAGAVWPDQRDDFTRRNAHGHAAHQPSS